MRLFLDGSHSLFNIADVRDRHCKSLNVENTKPFRNDPDDPSAAALKVKKINKKKYFIHIFFQIGALA